MAASPYDGTGERSPRWWPSRYGDGDRVGAGNELNPERTLEALRIPSQGRVIELAQVLSADSPAVSPRAFHQLVLAHGVTSAMTLAPEGSQHGWLEEQVTQGYHLGCHVDGLGHAVIGGRCYNGVDYGEVYDPTGLKMYGIEEVRSWVCRGVCLDVAAVAGTAILPAGFVITPAHLEDACERQGVDVRAGDAVLMHTGWGATWEEGEFSEEEPGCGWAAAHWLTDRRVSLVGVDNWGFEVIPFEDESKPFVVHQHLLAETGTHIVENIRTDELVASECSEFLFLMAPNKVRGATASMVSPLAVV